MWRSGPQPSPQNANARVYFDNVTQSKPSKTFKKSEIGKPPQNVANPPRFPCTEQRGRPQTTITCPFCDFLPHASPRSCFYLEQYWCQICLSLYPLQKDQVCVQRLHLAIGHVSGIEDRWLRVKLEESGAPERSHTVVYMTLRRIMGKDRRGLGTECGGS